MKRILIIPAVFASTILFCSLKVSTVVMKSYPAQDVSDNIRVIGIDEPLPEYSEYIGAITVEEKGNTLDVTWDVFVQIAQNEVHKSGGNAIKIVKRSSPEATGNNCYRLTASIYNVSDLSLVPSDSSASNNQYALFYIYSKQSTDYDLYLGKKRLCHPNVNIKDVVKIDKDGLNMIWAQCGSRTDIPVDIVMGHEYYIRCGMSGTAHDKRSSLEIVNSTVGRAEYNAIIVIPEKFCDRLEMNDGREIKCRIINEDDNAVYFSFIKNNIEISTHAIKSDIKSIHRPTPEIIK